MIARKRRAVSSLVSKVCAAAILSIAIAGPVAGHPAWGIVVSSTGVVYFSDLETIWKIDPTGKLTVARAGVSGRHVHELSIDSQDNVYGPEISYAPDTQKWITAVWKMTPHGKVSYLSEPGDRPTPGMSIWIDRSGNMYSVEQNNHTKTQTLLLRRTPAEVVTTLAGGSYGHADGKGTRAKFGSVNAITLGRDGNLYLTDGAFVRRVSMDGEVTTLAGELTSRTSEDKPTLFDKAGDNLAGVAVDSKGVVYVADSGNRRLLKINADRKVSVVYRIDPPYFPTGVFATSAGDVYVLEFSFTPPGTTGSPRVRKLSDNGQNQLVTPAGYGQIITRRPTSPVAAILSQTVAFVNQRSIYVVFLLSAGLITAILVWRTQKRPRT
jgi:NHL repeat